MILSVRKFPIDFFFNSNPSGVDFSDPNWLKQIVSRTERTVHLNMYGQ